MSNYVTISTLIAEHMRSNSLFLCSHTFANIQARTDNVWKMQRYHIIKEFSSKPLLCPPFILLAHIYLLCTWMCPAMCDQCCGCCRDNSKFGFCEYITTVSISISMSMSTSIVNLYSAESGSIFTTFSVFNNSLIVPL